MTTMHNPTHPGSIIRDDVLPELQLSVNEAAEQLGVSRVTLSRVINGFLPSLQRWRRMWANVLEMALKYGFVCKGSMTFGKPKRRENRKLKKQNGPQLCRQYRVEDFQVPSICFGGRISATVFRFHWNPSFHRSSLFNLDSLIVWS